jgi:hypothetical protein
VDRQPFSLFLEWVRLESMATVHLAGTPTFATMELDPALFVLLVPLMLFGVGGVHIWRGWAGLWSL